MSFSARQKPGHALPHQYRATGEVSGTRKFYRDRLGRFAANPTARAMKHVRWLWQLAEWKQMASNNDGPGDEPAAA